MRMSPDDWKLVLEVNLFGAFYMTKAVLAAHAEGPPRPDHQHHLRLRPGRADGPGQLLVPPKAGLIGLTKATRAEVASRGITANAVAPGFVVTELTATLPEDLQSQIRERTPLGRFGTPEEIAAAVAFLAPTRPPSSPARSSHRRRPGQ